MFSIWNYRSSCIWNWQRVSLWSPPLLWSCLPRRKHTSLHLQGLRWSCASPSSQFGRRLLQQGASFPSPMEMQQELSTELMGRHVRSRWPTIFCPICPSSCSEASPVTVGRAYVAWCTHSSPKPGAAPSPGTIRLHLQSGGSGRPFNSAWRCSLEEMGLPIPRSKVLPILMRLPQPFQNWKGHHFIIVNDLLSSSAKVTGLQGSWELKMVITEHLHWAAFAWDVTTDDHLDGSNRALFPI